MALGMYFYHLARKNPEKTKQQIIGMARHALGPDYDVGTHFTLSYNPWDQRLCLVPDSDLFKAIRAGQASVSTGHIETFTGTGITCEYVCRVLNHMRRRGYKAATPRRDASVEEEPFFSLTSGYVQLGVAMMPKQGSKRPWKLHRNYAMDAMALRFGRVTDGTMEFVRR